MLELCWNPPQNLPLGIVLEPSFLESLWNLLEASGNLFCNCAAALLVPSCNLPGTFTGTSPELCWNSSVSTLVTVCLIVLLKPNKKFYRFTFFYWYSFNDYSFWWSLSYSQQPNSDSVGFQFLGRGAVPAKCMLLNTHTCWNLAGEPLEHCWNLAGTLLLEPLAGAFCWEPMRASISFFSLNCFLLCLLCRVVMLEVWFDFCWSRVATLLEPKWGQLLDFLVFLVWQACLNCDSGIPAWTFEGTCWNPGMNLACSLGLQGCKITGQSFKLAPVYCSRCFRALWFQDSMTHETAPHMKPRKMQTNQTKLKLDPQVLPRCSESFLQDFLKGIPARQSCKSSPRRVSVWNPETAELWNLEALKPWKPASLDSWSLTI